MFVPFADAAANELAHLAQLPRRTASIQTRSVRRGGSFGTAGRSGSFRLPPHVAMASRMRAPFKPNVAKDGYFVDSRPHPQCGEWSIHDNRVWHKRAPQHAVVLFGVP